jgi:hypothetical protein
MTGHGTARPKGPDLKQTVQRSPFACARRKRETSVRFKKLVALSLAWQEGDAGLPDRHRRSREETFGAHGF